MIKLNNVTLLGIDGAGNRPLVTKAIKLSKKDIIFGDCILLSPNNCYNDLDDIKHIEIPKLSYIQWNRFVIKELYKFIQTQYYLFVDIDGFVINSNLWDDQFLDYDYVGAPWFDSIGNPHINYCIDEGIPCENNVGNGGFTLRSKKFLEVVKDLPYDEDPPKSCPNEDAYLCLKNFQKLRSLNITFAPFELAKKFSVERFSFPNINESFGFHGNKEFIDTIPL